MKHKTVFSSARIKQLVPVLFVLSQSCVALGADHEALNWVRSSEYVSVTDGTRLAVDCYRPPPAGEGSVTRLPVVWRFTPYGRRLEAQRADDLSLPAHGAGLNGPDALRALLNAGYAVCVADVRGYGASFGTRKTWLGIQDGLDARDITDWLATRPWSNGQIGMMGLSYLGSVQFLAVAKASPHLRAVFIAMGQFDHYDTTHDNGGFRDELAGAWDQMRDSLDFPGPKSEPGTVSPVDADHDRRQLQDAARAHRANQRLGEQMRSMAFRDSVDPVTGSRWHIENSPWNYLPDIESSGVPIYHWTGWWDAYAKGQLYAFSNLANPQRIHIGPYYHADRFGVDVFAEAIRWFDHWLKGIDNGVMDEPPVRYFIAGEDPSSGWRSANQWPPDNTQRRRLVLDKTKLVTVPSADPGSAAKTTVSPDWELGNFLERNNGVFRAEKCADRTVAPPECYADSGFPDLRERFEPGTLEFTTPPLEADWLMVGHSVARLWITTDAPDADLRVILSEVHSDGTVRLVTKGGIRLSHRAVGTPPFDTAGVPWISHLAEDYRPMTASPTRVTIDLDPVGNRFEQGHRIRLSVVATAVSQANPESFGVLYGLNHPSMVELPVLSGDL